MPVWRSRCPPTATAESRRCAVPSPRQHEREFKPDPLESLVRLRSIRVGNLVIEFKKTSPSRLYWAGRPAMRVVQALHWMKDVSADKDSAVMSRLLKVLSAPAQGAAFERTCEQV